MCYAPLQAAKAIPFVPSTSVKFKGGGAFPLHSGNMGNKAGGREGQVEFIVATSRGMCGVTSVYVLKCDDEVGSAGECFSLLNCMCEEREQHFKSILYLSTPVFLLPLHTFWK